MQTPDTIPGKVNIIFEDKKEPFQFLERCPPGRHAVLQRRRLLAVAPAMPLAVVVARPALLVHAPVFFVMAARQLDERN